MCGRSKFAWVQWPAKAENQRSEWKEEKEDIKEEYSEVNTYGLSKENFEADIKQEEKDYIEQGCIDDNTDALSSQKEYFEADIKEEEE